MHLLRLDDAHAVPCVHHEHLRRHHRPLHRHRRSAQVPGAHDASPGGRCHRLRVDIRRRARRAAGPRLARAREPVHARRDVLVILRARRRLVRLHRAAVGHRRALLAHPVGGAPSRASAPWRVHVELLHGAAQVLRASRTQTRSRVRVWRRLGPRRREDRRLAEAAKGATARQACPAAEHPAERVRRRDGGESQAEVRHRRHHARVFRAVMAARVRVDAHRRLHQPAMAARLGAPSHRPAGVRQLRHGSHHLRLPQ